MEKSLKNSLKKGALFLAVLITWLYFFHFSFTWGQDIEFTLDFETGDLRGWIKSDIAFNYQPTLGDNPTLRDRGQPSNHQGEYWIGTFEKYQGLRGQEPGDIQGDGPQGTLTSQPFTVSSGTLNFLVGGGSSFETRVELVITEGDPIEQTVIEERVYFESGRNTETMHRVTWDLAPYAGKTGRIRIVDASSGPWGHVNVDDFKFIPEKDILKGIKPKMVQRKMAQQIQADYRAFIEVNNRNPALGERVRFEGKIERVNQVNQEAQYKFYFGDGKIRDWSSEPVAYHAYEISGRYDASLEVRIGRRTFPSEALSITVLPVKLWLRVLSEPPFYPGGSVKFEVRPEPDHMELQYLFHFGDGLNSGWIRDNVVEHEFSKEGIYEVRVVASRMMTQRVAVVRAPGTAIGEATVIVRIEGPLPKIKVYLEADKHHVKVGEPIRFNATVEPDYPYVEYKFDFGDRTPTEWLSEPETEHSFRRSGIYYVSLVAKIDDRTFGSSKIRIDVERIDFRVFIEAEPTRISPGQIVVFKATTEPYIEWLEYSFVFGDGEARDWAIDTGAEHTYLERGTYRAHVRARIDGRNISSDRRDIRSDLLNISRSDSIVIRIDGIPPWIYGAGIVIGLSIIIGSGTYFLRRAKLSREMRESFGKKIKLRPQIDFGNQHVKSGAIVHSDIEIRLKPVIDRGEQGIQIEGSSLIDLRRNHE